MNDPVRETLRLDVLGIGDADIDIYLGVDHIPALDEKVLARSVALYPGGMVANCVVALQKLGLTCGFHGPVGDDDYGRAVLANFALHGVDTTGVVVKPGELTYFCVVLLDDSGEKALVVAPTSCLFPGPEDVQAAQVARARHIHTTAANRYTLEKVIDLARVSGTTVSLDLEPTMLWQPGFNALLEGVDVLFVNQRAISAVGEQTPAAAAQALRARGVRTVCITLGVEGVFVAQDTTVEHVPGFRVPVVDTTGAGDCFAAGFLCGYLNSWPVTQTARFANAVAAMKVTQQGGHAGSPHRNQVDAFLSARPAAAG